jgi:hypothetical protein
VDHVHDPRVYELAHNIVSFLNCDSVTSIHCFPRVHLLMSLEKDWYHVLSCFYYRQTGKALPFPPNRFKGTFSGIKNYEKYFNDTEFICHCEVILISTLMEMKESPTASGISKASCSMCYRFVRGVNEYLKEQGAPIWVVGIILEML